MPNIVFLKVCCLVEWSSVGLGWVMGPKFSLCDGLGRVSGLVGWVGLDKLDPRTKHGLFTTSRKETCGTVCLIVSLIQCLTL